MDSTVWFQNGLLHKKRSDLQAMCTSQPVLKFRPFFMDNSWVTDPFVLFQNSIRHEVQDLYVMLRKAAFRIDTFKTSHAIALQKWLVDFSQIVSLYFFVQESVIYPQILSRIDSDDRTLIIELRKKTQPLIDELLEIHKGSLTFVSACQGRDDEKLLNFDTASLYLALQQLSKQVFRCVAELEIFFTWELDHVAPEIRSCMNRKESRALQRNAIMKILSQRVGEDLLGAYSHWVPSEVKELYFASVDRFKLIRLRGKEKKWMRTHKSLQKTLASRTL